MEKTFTITEKQWDRIREWKKEVKEKVMKDFPPDDLQPDRPYFGAIGGGVTYSFTPTGMGTIFVVKYGNETIDLTDYNEW